MFFEQNRLHFFRPLTGKYREQVVECLRELYQRLYSASNADYGQALQRDNMIEIFQEALVRAPVLAIDSSAIIDGVEEKEHRFKNEREQAGWILNQLLEYGWLEKQVDEATLVSTFSFSRMGREFTEPFIQSDRSARTRHRNTRATYNALSAFAEEGDCYDLLDAYEHSERIISDFSDIIAELDDRRRELVKEMETQVLIQKASDQFFDFMEKRFQPDLAVRLSADSVEKYRDRIVKLLNKIRKKDKAFKAKTEARLRELVPDTISPGQSVLWGILEGIEYRIRAASDVMVPQVRRALQSFTKRADIIIRQMSYLASQQNNSIVDLCKQIAELSEVEQNQVLVNAGQAMSFAQAGFIDPHNVRLAPPRKRATIETVMDTSEGFDNDARKEIYIQTVLDSAFLVNHSGIKDYLVTHLAAGEVVHTRDLPITSANDLLAVSHAIEVAASTGLSSEYKFKVEYKDELNKPQVETEYFELQDEFTIELVDAE